MHVAVTSVLVGLALLVAAPTARLETLAANGQAAGPQPGSGRRLALLIGVTKFTGAGVKIRPLEGPANDVALWRTTLMSTMSVPEANIRVLAGLPPEESRRPTRRNIEAEFVRLSQMARPGDEVVIFMSGHGSQQPADPDRTGLDPEPDGLDEIFIPADVGPWDGSRGVVRNAIVDDDIRGWLTAIRNTGANVWFIADSCYSGTLIRGASQDVEVERDAAMSLLGIPLAAIDTARSLAARLMTPGATKSVLGLSESAGGIAAMYAAGSDQKTVEGRYTPGNSPVHGLFTYTLAGVIGQLESPVTYRELALRVTDRYRALQRFTPTPTVEGGAVDRELLGQRTWQARPRFEVVRSGTGWRIEVGTVSGVTTGSILEVFRSSGPAQADTSIGHVIVEAAQATSARVRPVAFGGRPAPQPRELASAVHARAVRHGAGDLRLKVALQVRGPGTGGANVFTVAPRGRGPAPLEAALAVIDAGTNGLVARVDTPDADWFVRETNGDVVLVPAGGWHADTSPVIDCGPGSSRRSDTRVTGLPVGRLDAGQLAESLQGALRKVAKVTHLARLGTLPSPGVSFDVTVARFRTPTGGSPLSLMQPPLRQPTVREGEYLEFRMRNGGSTPLDVTLLYVDAAFAITPILSGGPGGGRIDPGGQLERRPRITGCPLGWESVVVIAVEVDPTRADRARDFSHLAQAGLESGAGERAGQSALDDLLEAAAFGGTRNRGDVPIERFAVRTLSWLTETAPK